MGSNVVVDRAGEVHGRLTVIERAEDYVSRTGKRHVRWRCLCKCGTPVFATTTQLRSGNVRSCGCLRRDTNTERVLQDLTDQLFGDWVVVGRSAENYWTPDGKASKVLWVVECSCGTLGTATSGNLRQGQTKSCGHPSLPTYTSAHYHVAEIRGSANEYACVDCGALASSWAYNHSADVEIVEQQVKRGKLVTRRYSWNVFDYSPRCGRCHNRFDRR